MPWKHPTILAVPIHGDYGDLAPPCLNCGYRRGAHFWKGKGATACPPEEHPNKYKSLIKKKITIII